ncbi:DUF3597 domain-containing protein [Erythrobacter litoralis]|uniref:DUF3597 domain-containing protein n=1 Tax=Erythrobacter litoralis TaxID=39960 RepID=UPI002436066B|nr:DUF3597 domain-containing protein [Erythrobacter litoralis]MDG6078765.1 DUF3597 domain-containing protein [Erythrobacter litoralis]
MSIFGKIKDAIFGKEAEAKPAPRPAPTRTTPAPAPSGQTQTAPRSPPQSDSVAVVDVENHLDAMPGADRLNWRTSIVDLMKLIGVDSDYESRKALADEMGRQNYTGSPDDNIWLHRRVMNQLAANGGKVPASLRD